MSLDFMNMMPFSIIKLKLINPLSPNNDQHQISPCSISAYSTPEVMRIKSSKINFCDILGTSPQYFNKKSVETNIGEFGL